MKSIGSYEHRVASHCETGSMRNLLVHDGLAITEPMVFGLGSGPAFYYLFFSRSHTGFPLVGIRNRPGSIIKNVAGLLGVDMFGKRLGSPAEAMREADRLIDEGRPVIACVDMFYMKYLPQFLQVHAPFHFIILVGHDETSYAVSDPYFDCPGVLRRSDLEVAWDTHAKMSQDNFLAYARRVPREVDWRRAVIAGMKRTIKGMLPPRPVRRLLKFVGVEGMRMYARKSLEWPRRYDGHWLREGILWNAVAFEDQGTGGAAFRLMYGAFLQEASAILGSSEIEGLATKMVEHGQAWRYCSRRLIQIGKQVPMRDRDFPAWIEENRARLDEGLREFHDLFMERAAFEERFWSDLEAAVGRLGKGHGSRR